MSPSAELPVPAQIAVAMGLHRAGELRSLALSVATRFVLEFHRHGFNEPGWATLVRVSRRFRLGDYCTALLAHYPPKFFGAGDTPLYVGLDGRPVAAGQVCQLVAT